MLPCERTEGMVERTSDAKPKTQGIERPSEISSNVQTKDDRRLTTDSVVWDAIEEETPVQEIPTHPPLLVWRELRGKVAEITTGIITEGTEQVRASAQDGRTMLKRLRDESNAAWQRTWSFLTQPVWVPGRRSEPRQYSRGTLFLLDVVRFGGTFAFLFTLLFVGMNAESFWQIAKSRIDPLHDAKLQQTLSQEANGTLSEKLKRIPSLAVSGRSEGNLLSVLPTVGPPIPTLIIPRLSLNVPIAIPPADALLREDWGRLEEDIQHALQSGVVHYPGTARPGQAGNFFVTGHSSYFPWAPGRYKSVFARLGELEPGDEYWIFYGGERYRYRIAEKREVRPTDVTVLDQPMGKRLSTLMTCTPVGTTLRRLVLEAQEIDLLTGEPLNVGEHGKKQIQPKVRVEMLPI